VVARILKTVSEMHLRQNTSVEKVIKVGTSLNRVRGERFDQQNKMETEFKKVREELQEIKKDVTEENRQQTGEAEIQKLQ
jgi:uncharacterized membrane-anchored protein YhcB (DUF1043 family)